jgi:hypothetical protein
MDPNKRGGLSGPPPEDPATAKQLAFGDSTVMDPHEVYMYGLAQRIRWLERHRHWWLYTSDGRHQREFLNRRAA